MLAAAVRTVIVVKRWLSFHSKTTTPLAAGEPAQPGLQAQTSMVKSNFLSHATASLCFGTQPRVWVLHGQDTLLALSSINLTYTTVQE